MKKWATHWTGMMLVAGFVSEASAQVPGVPGAPPAAAPAAAAAGQAAGAAQPHKIKKFFADCKEKFCASPLGSLVNNSMQPIGALTGGILGNCCPPGPKAADLAKAPTSAQGAAARIQKDEAEAKARRAAVKYLGTVDCHYWPEAEAGLINALRADRNECVRFEAALALGRGCCCTKNVIEALSITVSGSDRDGNPSENSDRVKAAAQYALDHCLARACPVVEGAPVIEGKQLEKPPVEKLEQPPKKEGGAEKEEALLPPYYQRLQARSMQSVVEQARRTLEQSHVSPVVQAAKMDRSRSVSEIIMQAFGEPTSGDQGPGYVATQTPARPIATPAPVVVIPPTPRVEQPVVVRPTPAVEPARFPRTGSEGVRTVVQPSQQPRPMPNEMVRPVPQPVRPASAPQTGAMVKPVPTVPAPTRTVVTETPAATPRPESRRTMGILAPLFDKPEPVTTRQPMIVPPSAPAQVRPTPTTVAPPLAPVQSRPVSMVPVPASPPPTLAALAQGQPRSTPSVTPPQAVVQARATMANTAPARGTPALAAPLPATLAQEDARLRQVVQTLHSSNYPEHREWAAGQLGGSEMRTNPLVVPALVKAAREDKEMAVRCACIRSLGKMNANSPAVLAALEMLKSDPDARVRIEATQALGRLGRGPSAFAAEGEQAVRPR